MSENPSWLVLDGHVSPNLSDGSKRARALEKALAPGLDAGERVVCVVPVAKIQPSLNVLVVTTRRIVAGWDDEVAGRGWKVELPLPEVREITVTGFILDNVAILGVSGKVTKVGSLSCSDDKLALTKSFAKAGSYQEEEPVGHAETSPPQSGYQQPPTAPSRSVGDPTTYEVYQPGVNGPAMDGRHN